MVEPSSQAPKPEGVDITDCFSAHNTIWDELGFYVIADKMVF